MFKSGQMSGVVRKRDEDHIRQSMLWKETSEQKRPKKNFATHSIGRSKVRKTNNDVKRLGQTRKSQEQQGPTHWHRSAEGTPDFTAKPYNLPTTTPVAVQFAQVPAMLEPFEYNSNFSHNPASTYYPERQLTVNERKTVQSAEWNSTFRSQVNDSDYWHQITKEL